MSYCPSMVKLQPLAVPLAVSSTSRLGISFVLPLMVRLPIVISQPGARNPRYFRDRAV